MLDQHSKTCENNRKTEIIFYVQEVYMQALMTVFPLKFYIPVSHGVYISDFIGISAKKNNNNDETNNKQYKIKTKTAWSSACLRNVFIHPMLSTTKEI